MDHILEFAGQIRDINRLGEIAAVDTYHSRVSSAAGWLFNANRAYEFAADYGQGTDSTAGSRCTAIMAEVYGIARGVGILYFCVFAFDSCVSAGQINTDTGRNLAVFNGQRMIGGSNARVIIEVYALNVVACNYCAVLDDIGRAGAVK
uniref:hypothetical protein n=1 Tax=Candidatus Scatomorpha intestinigallinarum TaxID=2840923 RepID=UPI0040276F91